MIREYKDISLKSYNSFGVDVYAVRLIEFIAVEPLSKLLKEDKSILSGKWEVLGGGNNMLFTKNYDGTLLRPVGKKIELTRDDNRFAYIRAEAGVDWNDFVQWCVERELWGVENLAHIPGNVGSAPVQNIGAYGVEVKDVVVSVEILSTDNLKECTLAAEHCDFGYRESIFKNSLKGQAIITAVNFKLKKEATPILSYGAVKDEVDRLGDVTLTNIRQAIINIRSSKLPDPADIGNAGSFFKNPIVTLEVAENIKATYPDAPTYGCDSPDMVKLSAGWLIDKAGWKGKRRGNVGVYEKQALIIVNHGGAKGHEIIDFARDIQADIKKKFDIDLDTEVNIR